MSGHLSSSSQPVGLALPLPTLMQLERLWFESFADKAAAQPHDARAAAVREASRRLMRAVKRRLDPTLHQRHQRTPAAEAAPTKPVDRTLQAEAEAAERTAIQLADQMHARRAAVLARVRERSDKKLRLLYDAPIRAVATADSTSAQTSAPVVEAVVSVRRLRRRFVFLDRFSKKKRSRYA